PQEVCAVLHLLVEFASPNHALQRTPGFGVQLPSAAVVRPAQSRAVLPAMKPGTARAFALRRRAHSRVPGPESLSLGSLGDATSLVSNDALFKVRREPMTYPETHGLLSYSGTSFPSTALSHPERSTISASHGLSGSVVSPVSIGWRSWSSLTHMRSADSRFWPVVARRFHPTPATPN